MSDDPKIIKLPTGYEPLTPPPNSSELADLNWELQLLRDEVLHLSQANNTLTKGLRGMTQHILELKQMVKDLIHDLAIQGAGRSSPVSSELCSGVLQPPARDDRQNGTGD